MINTYGQELVKILNENQKIVNEEDNVRKCEDIKYYEENISNVTDLINQFSEISVRMNNIINELKKIEDIKLDDVMLLNFSIRVLSLRNNLHYLEQALTDI